MAEQMTPTRQEQTAIDILKTFKFAGECTYSWSMVEAIAAAIEAAERAAVERCAKIADEEWEALAKDSAALKDEGDWTDEEMMLRTAGGADAACVLAARIREARP